MDRTASLGTAAVAALTAAWFAGCGLSAAPSGPTGSGGGTTSSGVMSIGGGSPASSTNSGARATGGGGQAGSTSSGGGGTGGSPLAIQCPIGQFLHDVSNGMPNCVGLDTIVSRAVNSQCSIYFGWLDECNGCTSDPQKWGRVGGGQCTLGQSADNDQCVTANVDGGHSMKFYGLNTQGTVSGDDKFYLGLHCEPIAAGASHPGPCAPGELVTAVANGHVTCGAVDATVVDYLRTSCAAYLGWTEDCSGCGMPTPDKWGFAGDDIGCTAAVGGNDTCTTPQLGGTTVNLFGLNTDGNVGDDDDFYVGLHCTAPTAVSSTAQSDCPPGQFVKGVLADGSVRCATPNPAAYVAFQNHCEIAFGWEDNCDGNCMGAPAKLGIARDDACQNLMGQDDYCFDGALGSATVHAFALNTDGTVDENDIFYIGFGCF